MKVFKPVGLSSAAGHFHELLFIIFIIIIIIIIIIKTSCTCMSGKNEIVYELHSQHKHRRYE